MTGGIKMLKPSKRHFLRYDAQTYETRGFIELSGKVQEMAQKPRFWQITAKAITQDPKTGEQQSKHFKFNPTDRLKLGELAPIVNEYIHDGNAFETIWEFPYRVNEYIHDGDDFLPDCVSVMVCARVMTEGGV